MNIKYVIILSLILGFAGIASAESVPAPEVNVGNKICPVTGEKIKEGEGGTVSYKGKVYNLCCGMCKKDFNKDPEKYIQGLKDKGEIK